MREAGGEKAWDWVGREEDGGCRVGKRHRDCLGWEAAEPKAGWRKGALDNPDPRQLRHPMNDSFAFSPPVLDWQHHVIRLQQEEETQGDPHGWGPTGGQAEQG